MIKINPTLLLFKATYGIASVSKNISLLVYAYPKLSTTSISVGMASWSKSKEGHYNNSAATLYHSGTASTVMVRNHAGTSASKNGTITSSGLISGDITAYKRSGSGTYKEIGTVYGKITNSGGSSLSNVMIGYYIDVTKNYSTWNDYTFNGLTITANNGYGSATLTLTR